MRPLRLLVWQVHGGWMDAFVRGRHTYLLPVDRDGEGGVGARDWPANVVDVPEDALADTPFDAVILQRLEEFELVERLTGRRPGVDVPAVFVEHNTPRSDVPDSRPKCRNFRCIVPTPRPGRPMQETCKGHHERPAQIIVLLPMPSR